MVKGIVCGIRNTSSEDMEEVDTVPGPIAPNVFTATKTNFKKLLVETGIFQLYFILSLQQPGSFVASGA